MTPPSARRRCAAAVLLAVPLWTVGCGGAGDDDASTRSSAPAGASAEAGAGADAPEAVADTTATWARTARELNVVRGAGGALECPPDGDSHTVWGTDAYTDDSSLCTAAVHAGRITLRDGGRVAFEVRPGLQAYTGSSRHGIVTNDYGPWDDSFTFVDP